MREFSSGERGARRAQAVNAEQVVLVLEQAEGWGAGRRVSSWCFAINILISGLAGTPNREATPVGGSKT